MAAQPQKRVRKQLVWFSPALLAVALTPVFLQITCDRGNTDLSVLEFEVSGHNLIDGFDTADRSYSVSTSSDTMTLRAYPLMGNSTVSWQWIVASTTIGSGPIGVGGGEVVDLPIPLGQSVLRVNVRAGAPGTATGYYSIDVVRFPKFACSELGILDAIAFGGGPHYFACNGPMTVTTQAEIVIDNDVILDGEGDLTVDGNDDHRLFSVPAGMTAELRRCTSSEYFGQEGAFVKRRFMVLA